jgi:3-keto-disaccharide hydrolase
VIEFRPRELEVCRVKRGREVVTKSLVALRSLAFLMGLGVVAQTQPDTGWIPLFNGKDLTGWKNNGEEKWIAEQGTILCESTANKYGYLATEKTYRDFDLRLKFKGEASGNSGVFFHSKITGIDPQHGPDIEGVQVEVDPSIGKHTGGLYESGGRGWVIQPNSEGELALKPGEWNDLEVSVEGHRIITRLNGVKVVDYNDAAPKFTDGVIALQIHTGGGVRMRWKDIYIRLK